MTVVKVINLKLNIASELLLTSLIITCYLDLIKNTVHTQTLKFSNNFCLLFDVCIFPGIFQDHSQEITSFLFKAQEMLH